MNKEQIKQHLILMKTTAKGIIRNYEAQGINKKRIEFQRGRLSAIEDILNLLF